MSLDRTPYINLTPSVLPTGVRRVPPNPHSPIFYLCPLMKQGLSADMFSSWGMAYPPENTYALAYFVQPSPP
jgi:hypothetical protein